MPPRKKHKSTVPRRRSPRKKSSTVAKSTQIKAANSQSGTKPSAYSSEPSSEVNIESSTLYVCEADCGDEIEIVTADGAEKSKKFDEIDKDDEVDKIESTDDSDWEDRSRGGYLIGCRHWIMSHTAEDLTEMSFYKPDGSHNYLKLETARRLVAYVREDQPLIDPVHETASGQPKAGSSKDM
ncbi:unnamed protein product [Rhizoctonia solani]|uniref:Uncharacterized protein n=1 Tax=Rhizoctonia solani TaxID=456999 RepID=A0A8H3BJK1_9AGAM|nr:unnamed protein product [Rhizoctonia solani]